MNRHIHIYIYTLTMISYWGSSLLCHMSFSFLSSSSDSFCTKTWKVIDRHEHLRHHHSRVQIKNFHKCQLHSKVDSTFTLKHIFCTRLQSLFKNIYITFYSTTFQIFVSPLILQYIISTNLIFSYSYSIILHKNCTWVKMYLSIKGKKHFYLSSQVKSIVYRLTI